MVTHMRTPFAEPLRRAACRVYVCAAGTRASLIVRTLGAIHIREEYTEACHDRVGHLAECLSHGRQCYNVYNEQWTV
jgi:hypothetical protein